MRYWVQTQAPAGNWRDELGTNELERATSFAEYLHGKGHNVRVVERVDTVIVAPTRG